MNWTVEYSAPHGGKTSRDLKQLKFCHWTMKQHNFLKIHKLLFAETFFFKTKLLQCQYKKWYNFLFNTKSVWVVQALWEKTSDPQTNTAWFNPDQCLQGINKCRCGPQTNTAWFHPDWCPWAKTDVGWREWTCCRGNTAPQRWIMPTHVCLYCT